MEIAAGLDLGSTTLKLVLLEEGHLLRQELLDATAQPHAVAQEMLGSLPPQAQILATGYGRDLLEIQHGISTITEIKAHAAGARHLDPEATAVIDIGGQDVKVIKLDPAGRVQRFEMNDRCAAGTGKFLEVMAHRLGYDLDQFQAAASCGQESLTINAMCTVFAESEVVGLLHRGHAREDIGRALHQSIAKRIAGMFTRTGGGPSERVLCTGGGSRNACLVQLLKERLKCTVQSRPDSQFAGALGCALLAARPGKA